MVHHDLWDYDLPAQPSLVTVRHKGRMIDAVAQITKMGFVFVLDRVTGKPLFPVAERPVPQSNVPGEATWPTQPIPLKPAPLARQSMTRDEISRVTPESQKYCTELFDKLTTQGPPRRRVWNNRCFRLSRWGNWSSFRSIRLRDTLSMLMKMARSVR
jgi:quinoprotein glucose dehydrogenase